MTRADIIAVLLRILDNPEERAERIREFQEYVWKTSETAEFDEREWDVMVELAYDLDFYEPNPDWRREDPSYYGEDRLVREVHQSLARLGRK